MQGDFLSKLNTAQYQAVTTTEGFVRVIAGAGSGKTRALACRFAYLVNDIGILPGHILCVTFTNKSANEMRRRIHNLTGDHDTGYINTFHGFCVSVLQEDSHAVSYPHSFIVLDNSDIDDILRIIYEERGFTLRHMTFSNARDMIEMQKCFWKPDYCEDLIRMDLDSLKRKYETADGLNDIIFYGYLYHEKKMYALDYNDLIKFTLHIFKENADIRLKWQERLEYIMIDEFQDIDQLQYELMEVLCAYHKTLFVVGDPDQTIYTWRGASVRYLLDFENQFPNVQTIMMMENYRSVPQILNVANSLIDKNAERIDKKLIPVRGDGDAVICKFAKTPQDEAAWIAQRILTLKEGGIPLKDMAILYRAHYITGNLEDALIAAQVPYDIYSGIPFFERAEIKDALSYLRMIVYRDDLSFERVVNKPKRNMGRRRIAFLREKAEQEGITLYDALLKYRDDEMFKNTSAGKFIRLIEYYGSSYEGRDISDLLSEILDRSGYEAMLRTEGGQARLDNLAELKQTVYDYVVSAGEECTIQSFLTQLALLNNADLDNSAADKVKLMTVHAAKGLEFPCVFLCELNEGVFPSGKVDTAQGMEEERRLAFVAVTRAKDRLFLSMAGGRAYDGSPRYPSRFILDVDQDLLQFETPPKDDLIADTKEYIARRSSYADKTKLPDLFESGQRVTHKILGAGTVTGVNTSKGTYTIQFDAFDTPRTLAFGAKVLSKL
ncbi:MAG: UvrD-helicase domain-containing protein [Lachnospiraceae bacterium]|nr:UvrD-helicase domain-containing protein [Lachnospiraceae bacterium]